MKNHFQMVLGVCLLALIGMGFMLDQLASAAPPTTSPVQPPTFTLAINAFGQSFHSGDAIPLAIAVGNAGDETVYVPNMFNGFLVRVWEIHRKMPSACASIPFEPFKSRAEARREPTESTVSHPPSKGPVPSTDVATAIPARSGMTWFCPNAIHDAGPMTCGQPLRPGRYYIRIERDIDAFNVTQTTKDKQTGDIWINISTLHKRVTLISNIIQVEITAATGQNKCPVKLPEVTRYPND